MSKSEKIREIEEGHDTLEKKGKWQNVIFASNCDCGDPPSPFRNRAEMMEYLKRRQNP